MKRDDRIVVFGATGLVGSAIIRKLVEKGYENIIGTFRSSKVDNSLSTVRYYNVDLTSQPDVVEFFRKVRPDYVFLAAAKVGGILANSTYPAEFIYINLMIESNVIHAAYKHGVKRLLFLGSSCIYPKHAPQPMKEKHLLTGELEPTNEPYAVAKIAGIKMCQAYNRQYGTDFLSVMPTNLYGRNDNFDLVNSHVLPALIRKFHLAKLLSEGDYEGIKKDFLTFGNSIIQINRREIHINENTPEEDVRAVLNHFGISQNKLINSTNLNNHITLWGTGSPRREFLHVDDLADACVFLISLEDDIFQSLLNDNDSPGLINIGVGMDITIKELAEMIRDIVGCKGDIRWDSKKPDGTPRKLLDVSRLFSLGWVPQIGLREGILDTYAWYQEKLSSYH